MNKKTFLRFAATLFFISFSLKLFSQQNIVLLAETFGAKADGAIIRNIFIEKNSSKLYCREKVFSEKDAGKTIYTNAAGSDGATLISKIIAVISADTIMLSNVALSDAADTVATFGTDCTDAFVNINKAARADNDKNIVLKFSKGIYLTRFNNWLAGIKNIDVEGNGASIICTNGAYHPNDIPFGNVSLFMPCVFDNIDNNFFINKYTSDVSQGYKIKTVARSIDFVELKNGEDINEFKADDWVMLFGFEEENTGGYPPDERYFEYKKIAKIDESSGKVFFTEAIKNNYSEEWPDSTWSNNHLGIGAARMIDCNRRTFGIIENLVINDLNFISFKGWIGKLANDERNGRIQVYGVINAKFVNVNANALYIGTSKNISFDHCSFYAASEPDKEVENLSFSNCFFHKVISARGIDTLKFNSCKFIGEFTVSPRILSISNCDFGTFASGSSSSLAHIGFNGGTDSVYIGSNKWNCDDLKRKYLFGPGGNTALKVSNVLNDHTVTVSNESWADERNGRQVVPDHIGYCGNKSLIVENVYQYSPGIIAVEGKFSKPPQPGDVFVFSFIPKINVSEKQTMTGVFKNNYSFFADTSKIKVLKIFDR